MAGYFFAKVKRIAKYDWQILQSLYRVMVRSRGGATRFVIQHGETEQQGGFLFHRGLAGLSLKSSLSRS
jgi:hypothetical protein